MGVAGFDEGAELWRLLGWDAGADEEDDAVGNNALLIAALDMEKQVMKDDSGGVFQRL